MQSASNSLKHAVYVGYDVAVPEAQDPIIMLAQPPVARDVVGIVGVLPPIDFHDEPLLPTDKINDVAADGLLTDKFCTEQASPQPIPQAQLGVC